MEELNAFISVLGVIRADIDQHLVSRKGEKMSLL
jgi:hypothetical protein